MFGGMARGVIRLYEGIMRWICSLFVGLYERVMELIPH